MARLKCNILYPCVKVKKNNILSTSIIFTHNFVVAAAAILRLFIFSAWYRAFCILAFHLTGKFATLSHCGSAGGGFYLQQTGIL